MRIFFRGKSNIANNIGNLIPLQRPKAAHKLSLEQNAAIQSLYNFTDLM